MGCFVVAVGSQGLERAAQTPVMTRRFTLRFVANVCDDHLASGELLVEASTNGRRRHLARGRMLCPCGCGRAIVLNLDVDAERDPCWTLTSHDPAAPTIAEPIRVTRGCRTSFRLVGGRVEEV